MIALAAFGIVAVIAFACTADTYIDAWERIEKLKIEAQRNEAEKEEKF